MIFKNKFVKNTDLPTLLGPVMIHLLDDEGRETSPSFIKACFRSTERF